MKRLFLISLTVALAGPALAQTQTTPSSQAGTMSTTPTDTAPDSTMSSQQSGTMSSGGTMQSGTMQSGTMSNGSMQNGTMQNGTMAQPGGAMNSAAPTMGPMVNNPPPPAPASYPRCSRTVTDSCIQSSARESDTKGGRPAHRRSRHR